MSSAVKLMLVERTMFFSTTSSSVRKSKTRSDDITGCQVQKNWPWTPLEAKVAAAAMRVLMGTREVRRVWAVESWTRRVAPRVRFPMLFTITVDILLRDNPRHEYSHLNRSDH